MALNASRKPARSRREAPLMSADIDANASPRFGGAPVRDRHLASRLRKAVAREARGGVDGRTRQGRRIKGHVRAITAALAAAGIGDLSAATNHRVQCLSEMIELLDRARAELLRGQLGAEPLSAVIRLTNVVRRELHSLGVDKKKHEPLLETSPLESYLAYTKAVGLDAKAQTEAADDDKF